MLIADLLKHKGSAVVTVGPHDGLKQVLASLAEHKVGALVVLSGDSVTGIISERDVVRRLHAEGAAVLDRTVADVMTSPVLSCTPDDPVEKVAGLMTEGRFRHMPVLRDGSLAGIVTIGDVVAARIRQLETDRGQLESYIAQGG